MLHKSHRVIFLASAHCLDARAEARNGQDDNIANLLRLLHAREVGKSDVATAGAHVEIGRIVEEGENAIGPQPGPSELDYAFVVLGELALSLALQGLLGDVGDHVNEDGVSGLRLDGPLAELDATRVPVSPIRAIRISLDANDHAV